VLDTIQINRVLYYNSILKHLQVYIHQQKLVEWKKWARSLPGHHLTRQSFHLLHTRLGDNTTVKRSKGKLQLAYLSFLAQSAESTEPDQETISNAGPLKNI